MLPVTETLVKHQPALSNGGDAITAKTCAYLVAVVRHFRRRPPAAPVVALSRDFQSVRPFSGRVRSFSAGEEPPPLGARAVAEQRGGDAGALVFGFARPGRGTRAWLGWSQAGGRLVVGGGRVAAGRVGRARRHGERGGTM